MPGVHNFVGRGPTAMGGSHVRPSNKAYLLRCKCRARKHPNPVHSFERLSESWVQSLL